MRMQLILLSLLLSACISIPEGIKPVEDFEASRYLGKWYEIARLDHSFERGLDNVSAEYSLRKEGGLLVRNRGFDVDDQEWSMAEGRAYFVGEESVGHLKVSFFRPFYGSYAVFELGENYEYAFVTGNDRSSLWFLSRSPQVAPALMAHFYEVVKTQGFATSEIIEVSQARNVSRH